MLYQRLASYRNLHNPSIRISSWFIYINRQTAFYGLVQILEQLVKCITLGHATGDSRYFGPITAFFGVVNNYF